MKLAIGLIFYNCKPELERLLNSIPKGVIDAFIGVDGIFRYINEQNPHLPDISDDIVYRLLHKHRNKFDVMIGSMNPNSTEYAKRNTYLEICKELGDIDYLIIMDSDEYFQYNEGMSPERSWDIFRKNFEMLARKNGYKHNVFSIRTWDTKTNTESNCPRCWFNPGDMKYLFNSHYHYGNPNLESDWKKIRYAQNNKLTYCQETRGIIKGITLAHNHDLRTKEQLELREKYQRYLVAYESLVQNGYSPEKADKIAKLNPSKDFNPTE